MIEEALRTLENKKSASEAADKFNFANGQNGPSG